MSRVAPIPTDSRSRFVLLCQQTLALALVTAVLAPATQVTTLDIVAPPHQSPPHQSLPQQSPAHQGPAHAGVARAISPAGAAARR